MKIDYRKAGNRTFYRIEGEQVTRVINKLNFSSVEVGNDYPLWDSATDTDQTRSITEVEFKAAFNEALERIKLMKIV